MRNTFILTNACIGRDAEIREVGGQKKARFTVAESENYRDKSGNWQERTQWHQVVIWGAAAERSVEKAKKGISVNIFGSYRIDQYEQDGVKKTMYYILADRVEYLYPKHRDAISAQQQAQENIDNGTVSSVDDDVLPF